MIAGRVGPALLATSAAMACATLPTSTGCRPRPTCGPADAGCDGEATLAQGDLTRTYRYHLPRRGAEDAGEGKRPLLLALHGGGGTGKGMESITHFDAVADEEGFVVVYPDGLELGWNDGRVETPAGQRGADDVGFVSALIDHFAAGFAADPARVYVAGLSNGAMMSLRVACDLAGKVTAVGAVAGLHPETLGTCKLARPIPVVLFAGTADPIVPYAGGPILGDRGRVLSAPDTFGRWASLDGCTPAILTTDLPHTLADDRTRTHRLTHPQCVGGARVALYSIEGGGHTWPGGKQYLPEQVIGYTARELDASREMWRFFTEVGPRRLLKSEVPSAPSAAP
jgi:polyhydroxybutyrate depolymerase